MTAGVSSGNSVSTEKVFAARKSETNLLKHQDKEEMSPSPPRKVAFSNYYDGDNVNDNKTSLEPLEIASGGSSVKSFNESDFDHFSPKKNFTRPGGFDVERQQMSSPIDLERHRGVISEELLESQKSRSSSSQEANAAVGQEFMDSPAKSVFSGRSTIANYFASIKMQWSTVKDISFLSSVNALCYCYDFLWMKTFTLDAFHWNRRKLITLGRCFCSIFQNCTSNAFSL
jgi:hypothetical protein